MNHRLKSLANVISYFTIKDPHAAKRLVDKVIESENDSIILPFIDHPGPISAEILSRKFACLTVCEHREEVKLSFQDHVSKKFPHQRVNIYPDNLLDLTFKANCDDAQKRCSDIVRESFEATQQKLGQSPNCNKHVKVLVPLLKSRSEVGFLRNLYYQMSLRLGLCSNHLVHYYLLMSDRQYNYLRAKPGENLQYYRSSTILYNSIFNLHRLDSFDLKSCFQINLSRIQKTVGKNSALYKEVHAIWLEPRLDVIDRLTPNSLIEYRFFVNQLMYKRTSLVRPSIDKWFRTCDHDMARLGITNTTKSGDLDKDQFIELFSYLINLPDYKNSSFLQAAACAEDNILYP